MAKHLYETLGISKDASPDDVRRAYRQAALKTHPDKQPQGLSDKDKQHAREKFENVTNAYEVLSDEEKRRIYDRYGEFPPPEVQQEPHGGSRDPFDDPFFSQPLGSFGSRSRSRNDPFFSFTDPFALFEQLFGDMRRQFDDPAFGDPFPSASPLGRSPFGGGSLFDRMMGPSFGMLPPADDMFGQSSHPMQGQTMSFQSSSHGMLARGSDGKSQWVSQSKMTRSVNGVRESVWKRTDSNGNEHVTYSYPDGRERYLINGVEQPSSSRGERSLPPPPPYPGPPAPLNTSYRPNDRVPANMNYSPTYARPPPGSYAEPTAKRGYDYDRDRVPEREHQLRHREHKRRHSRENYETYGQQDPRQARQDEHQRKHWWKGEW
ncbi:hypothetical protein ACEPAH_3642 [Sanghuangporus vaninii]